ncbi:MAG TPA: UDP-3-O-(3-hydroxymyristoyl)glucosamine N-acyltransferase [Bacteroidales bacterium]|nr:UDP-3-O-(3-hydroxymyristoyl)glucosamine N-acyltransferase [Bacteroidales bacterium]
MKFDSPQTLKKIAGLIHARFVGDPDFLVSGINEIHMVEPGDLTFVDHPKYYDKALKSEATTIVINKDVDPPAGKALIISDHPFDDYVFLVTTFRPFEKAVSAISPSAGIGEGTIIQPGAFVGNHVKIGKNCIIHANASIYDHCVIGNNVIIHSGAVIGADAFYFQRRPEGYKKLETCGRAVLEDNVEVGAMTTIDKGVSGDTYISFGTKFDNHVQVGHDTYIGRNCLIGAFCAIAGVTRIEDDVILWASVLVNKDLVIGKGAIVLAGSGTEKSLEGGKTYWGIPAIEARKKWREVAALKMLPDILQKLK